MAREQHGARAPQPAHQLADLDHLGRVEADRGLVQDEDGWVAAQGLGEPDALAVALGQRPDAAPCDALETAVGQDARDRSAT